MRTFEHDIYVKSKYESVGSSSSTSNYVRISGNNESSINDSCCDDELSLQIAFDRNKTQHQSLNLNNSIASSQNIEHIYETLPSIDQLDLGVDMANGHKSKYAKKRNAAGNNSNTNFRLFNLNLNKFAANDLSEGKKLPKKNVTFFKILIWQVFHFINTF